MGTATKGDLSTIMHRFPAKVVASRAIETDKMLAQAKNNAPDPTIFDENEPFFWAAEISNGNLDFYFTRMMPSSLRNYAAACESGVPFQANHNTYELSLGRSLAGTYISPRQDGLARVEATFYTMRDLKLGSVDTTQFINGLRAGIIGDVSIGFYGGRWVCSICDLDMAMDWDCPHWPGVEYENVKNGLGTGQYTIAEAHIEDAQLSEVSIVYAGATPGAMVLKAERMAEAGTIKPVLRRYIENQFRIALPEKRIQAPGFGVRLLERPAADDAPSTRDLADLGVPHMAADESPFEPDSPAVDLPQEDEMTEPNVATLQADVERAKRDLDAAQAKLDAAALAVTEATKVADERQRTIATIVGKPEAEITTDVIRAYQAEQTRTNALAADGRQYRVDLIDEAVAEGVRAFGDSFAVEEYKSSMESMPLAMIKRMKADWSGVGDRNLGSGGRRTKEGDEPTDTDVPKVPASAYRS